MIETYDDLLIRIELLKLITIDLFDIQKNHHTTLTAYQRVQIFELLEDEPLHILALMYRETAYREVITTLQLHKQQQAPDGY